MARLNLNFTNIKMHLFSKQTTLSLINQLSLPTGVNQSSKIFNLRALMITVLSPVRPGRIKIILAGGVKLQTKAI